MATSAAAVFRSVGRQTPFKVQSLKGASKTLSLEMKVSLFFSSFFSQFSRKHKTSVAGTRLRGSASTVKELKYQVRGWLIYRLANPMWQEPKNAPLNLEAGQTVRAAVRRQRLNVMNRTGCLAGRCFYGLNNKKTALKSLFHTEGKKTTKTTSPNCYLDVLPLWFL